MIHGENTRETMSGEALKQILQTYMNFKFIFRTEDQSYL